MTFFDEQGNVIDVTMQDLQQDAQSRHNHSLINEEYESSYVWNEAVEETIASFYP